ncbi:MAG: hypothetical protein KJ832_18215 [Gammaproteobacteria bacterium]|nr:hypothetical protein [Gammaproteobacteria bacterium]
MLLVLGLAGIGAGWYADEGLPSRAAVVPQVLAEPLQTAVQLPAFTVRAEGIDYRIEPAADYDISGIVVSRHDSDAWWDWFHAASNDHLNVVDICMVWGANARDGAYQKMSFSSGQFVCYWNTRDSNAAQSAYVRSFSNNHILTENPLTARQLRRLRIGDQVRLRGQLVTYRHNAGMAFSRSTSLTRDDTGDGACETVFVRDIEVLRRGSAWPRWLMACGVLVLLFGLWAWYSAPHRPRN